MAELKAILLKDGGLLVELKRWVATDAANHGQIVSDSDLSDDAIYDRLETDVEFRAVATALVQRYGYLRPMLNPLSDEAKQRDLLIQERTKWIAQRQEEELARARQRETPGTSEMQPEPARNRSPQTDSRDPMAPAEPAVPNEPANASEPALPNPSNAPDSFLRTQLDRTGEANAEPFALPFSTLENVNANSADAPSPQPRMREAQPEMTGRQPSAPAANGGFDRTNDGLLAPSAPVTRRRPEIAEYPAVTSAPQPDLIRTLTPYTDVPSLYDMYVQAVPRLPIPRRFGADVFESASRDPQLIPMDLPVGPEYVVGPGDGLAVDLWGSVSQRLYRTVDREGRISLPEVGPILVSGKSLVSVQQSLQQILRTQFRDVSADISLARLRTIRIYEVGDVTHPGAYDISSLSTPLNALFAASGPTERGSMRLIKHYRGTQLVQTVDLYDLLLHGVKADLQRLENGDTVQVPPIGPRVTMEGMVRRPAVYELRDEKSLSDAIELAGGLLPTAVLRHIEVQRIVDHEKQTMMSLDLPDAEDAAKVMQAMDAFQIHDGDRIRIYPIAPYNQDSIYLEGHILRPGRYSFRAGMRVTDVISSYEDLLPEPAGRYAEIIRLNPPDFHPSVEGFNLAKALADPAHAPQLHPMDAIRIFSRFDFENPPTVSVMGDVRAPGTYRTSGEVRLADAIHFAQGLSPDAQTADAQVFRYLPDGKFKIFSVSLGKALDGDAAENILLQPRDRLLVHKNPNAVEPATVYVQGEVAKPGRYPLTTNMRVAELVQVGGGLKPSADTQTADLTRYQWSAESKLTGAQQEIALSAALDNHSDSNLPLHNGDVLTIRQLPGWNDLGASITLKGEVKHPGTYGIRPGERLSSILERAGGFQPDAYPYGAVLQRQQVRDIESRSQAEILKRLRDEQTTLELLPETDERQKQAKAVALQQAQSSIEQLSASPVVGRVTIRVTSQIDRWKGTPADIEARAGDTLTVPKAPSYVMVTGQVYTPTAVSYRPGKSAKWYLTQSGGPTQMGNKKAIFVVRADGSIFGAKNSLWSGESLSSALRPGDTVVVPERAIAGGQQWQSVLLSAQAASAIASTVFIALRY